MAYSKSGKDEAYFNSWITFIEKLQDSKKTKKFTGEFMSISLSLFERKRLL